MKLNQCQFDMLRDSILKTLKNNGVKCLTPKKIEEALDEFEWELERVKELTEKLDVKESTIIRWSNKGIDLRDDKLWQIIAEIKQERDFIDTKKVLNDYLDLIENEDVGGALEFFDLIGDEDINIED